MIVMHRFIDNPTGPARHLSSCSVMQSETHTQMSNSNAICVIALPCKAKGVLQVMMTHSRRNTKLTLNAGSALQIMVKTALVITEEH